MAAGTVTLSQTGAQPSGLYIYYMEIFRAGSFKREFPLQPGVNYLVYVVYHNYSNATLTSHLTLTVDGVQKVSMDDPSGPVPGGADRGCTLTSTFTSQDVGNGNICIDIQGR